MSTAGLLGRCRCTPLHFGQYFLSVVCLVVLLTKCSQEHRPLLHCASRRYVRNVIKGVPTVYASDSNPIVLRRLDYALTTALQAALPVALSGL